MRRLLATIVQLLVDAEATTLSAPNGANAVRRARTRVTALATSWVATATGDIAEKIPKVRTGSFFPSLLAPAPAGGRGVTCGRDAGLGRGRVHDVVGIFPDGNSLLRLAACVLIETMTSGKSPTGATCPRPPWPN
jgi:hypothetical protein